MEKETMYVLFEDGHLMGVYTTYRLAFVNKGLNSEIIPMVVNREVEFRV